MANSKRLFYIVGLMDGAIEFSAVAVECAINYDERMRLAVEKKRMIGQEVNF